MVLGCGINPVPKYIPLIQLARVAFVLVRLKMVLFEIFEPPTTEPVIVIPTIEAALFMATLVAFVVILNIVFPVIVCPPPLAWTSTPLTDPVTPTLFKVRFRMVLFV